MPTGFGGHARFVAEDMSTPSRETVREFRVPRLRRFGSAVLFTAAHGGC